MTDTGLPARKSALAILTAVLRQRRPLDSQLEGLKGLSPRDAGFARALASESLRHFGELDAVIRKFVPKPLAPHKSGTATEILILGTCELLILKSAAHAAVDAANRLATSDNKAVHFKSLINAVLRRISREGEAARAGLDRVRLNTPDWLWTRWSAQYGEDAARAIASASQKQAPLDISVKPTATPPEAAPLFGNSYRLHEAARVEELPGFAQGDWWVQDCAASLPALLLGDVKDKRVIDLCAAPGGKTLQLAARGAKVVAVDADAARLERVKDNLARTHLEAEWVVSDARDYEGTAPFVLIDAPCSATGTIRRHPDLPWIKGAADVNACALGAYDILEAGAAMVEPGGTLVFAVCSLEREEGEEQIAAFLDAHPEFTRAPVTADDVFGHSKWITPDGDLRTLPSHIEGGMDGFYAARLRKE